MDIILINDNGSIITKIGDIEMSSKSPKSLKRLLRVNFYENGYLEVNCLYKKQGQKYMDEEYFDIAQDLLNHGYDPNEVLKDVRNVILQNVKKRK